MSRSRRDAWPSEGAEDKNKSSKQDNGYKSACKQGRVHMRDRLLDFIVNILTISDAKEDCNPTLGLEGIPY